MRRPLLPILWILGNVLLALELGLASSSEDPLVTLPSGIRRVQALGVHNAFALGTNLISGSSPEGNEGFASLARLGVKTVISVDGAKPAVDLARQHGLRYIHLPMGYDGISASNQVLLAKIRSTVTGPVYIHCHHGKHRGPAAAAILSLASGAWTPEQANDWLRTAGTGTNYVGLYRSVREFRRPTPSELGAASSTFSEVNRVSGMVEWMVRIDMHWDRLKAARATGYRERAKPGETSLAHEALMLVEALRETRRLDESERKGTEFLGWLRDGEEEAGRAEQWLRELARAEDEPIRRHLDLSFDAIGRSCTRCHNAYRD